ncbi:hypothetical protein CTAYLR_003310 [Chrysophaeum taylorii]|uniref:SAM-dependent MTase RsmB/NOP-type domain-containing protein n=1 Tax=Chrysophaeum taylorii TaxID=2483200 RepID=A0AAD7UIN8_9STRA|nr:hypothetical protein CTAYLR_003310 [Chrysophaeum taylorii]
MATTTTTTKRTLLLEEDDQEEEEEDGDDLGPLAEDQDEDLDHHHHQDDDDEGNLRNPGEVLRRITKTVRILGSFRELREGNRPRAEYLSQLSADLSEYFGILEELVELFLRMFSPTECLEFLQASDKPRPVVIRANTLKTKRKDLLAALSKRGVRCEPVARWSNVGIKISESEVPVGATPEYLAGHYMLQSAASLCPVIALDPQPNERILDVAAAPGGKTTYIAQLMRNAGTIVANDLKKDRHKATVANLHRLGVTNAIACVGDGRTIPGTIGGFDRVLLDAPCTGLGVMSRDPSIKGARTLADVTKLSHLQRQLIVAALDALKPGGILVYSTCSVSVEENEAVVQYALDARHCALLPCLDHATPAFQRYHRNRFHPSMGLARRFYPHTHNMDGFFVAKLKKTSNGRRAPPEEEVHSEEPSLNDKKKRKSKEEDEDSFRNNNKKKMMMRDDEEEEEEDLSKKKTMEEPSAVNKKKKPMMAKRKTNSDVKKQPAETAVAETAVAETAVAETAVAETAVAETAVAETAVAETAVAETAVAETAVAETAVAETAVAETAVAETAVASKKKKEEEEHSVNKKKKTMRMMMTKRKNNNVPAKTAVASKKEVEVEGCEKKPPRTATPSLKRRKFSSHS